ncbi:PhzF family phenazine biosynthesis protein [Povalibacter uvarum]|uniref:PhzF family phenazine biosynthesis protein n=1 Tax=Povalibacter uvarum TaxID=732238 RepID=A0A841HMM8_9GAMM|nr:PhzF family phenazine biosynthesis protein [Povalibacter uvarum]MBB6094367.1 PhzF family phenazine biosynthesis protein [Povalibacter uvarum]
MPSLPFRIVNVFTQNGGRLTGNPLGVFENGSVLSDEAMQALARQFNLSETTFILPSTTAQARVRIFTPDYEMPFAGHPTLGTAFVCRSLGLGGDELTLEMRAGVIPVKADGDRWTLQANAPTWREVDASRADIAAMLQLETADVADRPLWVEAGKEQLVIPLTNEAAVRRALPDARLVSRLANKEGQSNAYVFAETAPGRCLSRYFFPSAGAMLEDPATGSATANLGGWLVATKRKLPHRYEISQGEYVGRPSILILDVTADGRILVSGDVIEIGRGTIEL